MNRFMVLHSLLFPAQLFHWNNGSGRDEEPSGEKSPPDQNPVSDAEPNENYVKMIRR